ncbi:MAG: hypothetical protein V7727_02205 [Sneathiella sp.]
MKILSGNTTRKLSFVALDATDLQTREPGLASFTVYRSRNGAAAAAMDTPTISETDATNMPGIYALTIDEDTTITEFSEELVFHITHAGMHPVSMEVELYNLGPLADSVLDEALSGHATAGTLGKAVTDIEADTNELQTDNIPGALAAIDALIDAIKAVTDVVPDSGALTSLATAAALGTVDTNVDAIKVSTDNLPSDPADQSLLIDATTAIITAIEALNNLSSADILGAALTESYAAKGADGTLTQILYTIQQRLLEAVQTGTTISVKGVDSATEKLTMTVNDAAAPTSITRAT